jgi:Mycothiol maleylpyruvate isomerase N-terminal domain
MGVDFSTAVRRLTAAYEGIDRLAASFTRDDLLEFSRCRGWVVADVLFHVLCDAQRALIALASTHPGPSDRDFVTYWQGFAGDRDPIPAAIHHLDMTVHLPSAPGPDPDALAAAAATLDGLRESSDAPTARPAAWTTETYVLKGTGRIPLTADEAAQTPGYPLLS